MKQISTDHNETLPDFLLQKLPDYIKGVLPKQEEWQLEELMNHDQAFSDAVEGLKSLENPAEIFTIHQAINTDITAKYSKNKRKKKLSPPLFFPAWIVLLMGILILVVLAGFVIISLLK